jgi:hypothetical protein
MTTTKGKAASTVIVACKLPHGLILRTFARRSKEELVMGGGSRTIEECVDTGERFVINGTAAEQGRMPVVRNGAGLPGDQFAHVTDTGYALTYNVPKSIWDSWLEDNKNSLMVKNGLIFAAVGLSSVKSMGKEFEKQRTGLEAIDPNNPGGRVEPTEDMKKRMQGDRLRASSPL